MDSESHIALFQKIAGVYQLFFKPIARNYTRMVGNHLSDLGIPEGGRILDVGCGTGAFGYAFAQFGYTVHGVDGAPAMAAIARRNGVQCTVSDGSKGLPFTTGAFDMVTAAFVVHGLVKQDRIPLLKEMARVSNGGVLIHDYSPAATGGKLSYVRVLEWLERSDFKGFRRTGLAEMGSIFSRVNIIHQHPRFCWYLCR